MSARFNLAFHSCFLVVDSVLCSFISEGPEADLAQEPITFSQDSEGLKGSQRYNEFSHFFPSNRKPLQAGFSRGRFQ